MPFAAAKGKGDAFFGCVIVYQRPGSWIIPNTISRSKVATTEIKSDLRQPMRLLKKNMPAPENENASERRGAFPIVPVRVNADP